MSASTRRRLLVAYDVPDDRRRTRLATILSTYGDRVQYSVFIVDASPVRIARLRRSLERTMDSVLDSVLLCDLGDVHGVEERRFQYLRRQRPLTGPDSFIV